MTYETVIGLEVHAQLDTKSKIFCGSSAAFGGDPNEHTCTVDLGLPGVLPVLNREVVEYTLRLGLAVGGDIASVCRFARKHYFYPDLPKGYQISQYEEPICTGGSVHFVTKDGREVRINLTRIHMEEDAGKLIHGDELGDPKHSYSDLNRAGVPLLEIVSEPELRNPEDAESYMRKLRTLVRYLGISDGNMQEGSLRCDANISLRLLGNEKFGEKVEIKNMNSFRNLRRALEYEEKRQSEILDSGGVIHQETRLWDESAGVTRGMRTKEYAHDYRYFPDPDLVPLTVDRKWLDEIRAKMPELPDAKSRRFQDEFGLPRYDAEVLTAEKELAAYFDRVVVTAGEEQAKTASNWVMGDVLRLLNEQKIAIEECPISPEQLAKMILLITDGVISGKIAKSVFDAMAESGEDPETIVEEKGLKQITDTDAIGSVVEEVLASNPDEVEAYQGGKTKLMGFFVGQVMKATQGKANPKALQEILRERLGS
ncbi:MAG: Asp-tRNA(Asn)/Glu-tRNA(Gln) amidotransferase subunit GatB [Nitrospinae bacterium]|nr:Asp-tRNA(Asn)/Glu-tRNA(Gln) amidotransferase subunit GatB [Nitrospinota bacterium]